MGGRRRVLSKSLTSLWAPERSRQSPGGGLHKPACCYFGCALLGCSLEPTPASFSGGARSCSSMAGRNFSVTNDPNGVQAHISAPMPKTVTNANASPASTSTTAKRIVTIRIRATILMSRCKAMAPKAPNPPMIAPLVILPNMARFIPFIRPTISDFFLAIVSRLSNH